MDVYAELQIAGAKFICTDVRLAIDEHITAQEAELEAIRIRYVSEVMQIAGQAIQTAEWKQEFLPRLRPDRPAPSQEFAFERKVGETAWVLSVRHIRVQVPIPKRPRQYNYIVFKRAETERGLVSDRLSKIAAQFAEEAIPRELIPVRFEAGNNRFDRIYYDDDLLPDRINVFQLRHRLQDLHLTGQDSDSRIGFLSWVEGSDIFYGHTLPQLAKWMPAGRRKIGPGIERIMAVYARQVERTAPLSDEILPEIYQPHDLLYQRTYLDRETSPVDPIAIGHLLDAFAGETQSDRNRAMGMLYITRYDQSHLYQYYAPKEPEAWMKKGERPRTIFGAERVIATYRRLL